MQPLRLNAFIESERSYLKIVHQDEHIRAKPYRSFPPLFCIQIDRYSYRITSIDYPELKLYTFFIKGACKKTNPELEMTNHGEKWYHTKTILLAVSMNSHAVYPSFALGIPISLRWSECNQ